jgi:hypothetical protein
MLHATTITFNQPYGTQITNQYAAEGVIFQTEDWDGTLGAPAIGWGNGLSNSYTGDYPTTEYLDILFPSGWDNVSFLFDNYGSDNGSYYTAYSGSTALETVSLDTPAYWDSFGFVPVPGSNITEIQISNNTGGDDSWEFSIQNVSNAITTPEPATLSLLGYGLLGLCAVARRKFRQ